ncbi:MAG: hypothetical protein IJ009_04485 [Clostridia bacterium]|nr:hypothetical protein [Clostridia bacterium]
MFNHIALKIKTVAEVTAWIGIILSCFFGFTQMYNDDDLILTGLITIALGSLLSWLASFVLYGFGQLIENTDILRKHLCESQEKAESKNGVASNFSSANE